MRSKIEVGDRVHLTGALPGQPPWTVIRIGVVGDRDDRATIATLLRDRLDGGAERQLVNVGALRRVEFRRTDP